MFRVGRIPYLNCEPFFAHLSGFPTLDLPPRQLGEALARGDADAAALSLADFCASSRRWRHCRSASRRTAPPAA
jgi:predicted solute-binding protein